MNDDLTVSGAAAHLHWSTESFRLATVAMYPVNPAAIICREIRPRVYMFRKKDFNKHQDIQLYVNYSGKILT